MPRVSERKRLLLFLRAKVREREEAARVRLLLEDSDDDSTGTVEDAQDDMWRRRLAFVGSNRYMFRRKRYRLCSGDTFRRDLFEAVTIEDAQWLSDAEFLTKFRMSRDSFGKLLGMIENHEVFQVRNDKRRQTPVSHQLMVFLHYLGHGCGNQQLRQLFGLGHGTATLFKTRCVKAIRSLREQAIKWPDELERYELAKRIYSKYQLLHCIGTADGTLFPLKVAPQSKDYADYHGRKFAYSLTVMIVNDDQRLIRAYLSGFPGSAHDNRVYDAMGLATNPTDYFSDVYFLVADSAIKNRPSVVSSYKAPRGGMLSETQEKFNTKLGSFRVTSEHTIGILKGRFPILRNIPMVINDDPNSVKKILRVIDACMILHNLLIHAHDYIPDDWIEREEDDEHLADTIGQSEYAAPIEEEEEDSTRRSRLLNFLMKEGHITAN